MLTIIVVVIVLLLLFGGGGYRYSRGTGYVPTDLIWIVLAVVIVFALLRYLGVL
jgi:hypothetical protein